MKINLVVRGQDSYNQAANDASSTTTNFCQMFIVLRFFFKHVNSLPEHFRKI